MSSLVAVNVNVSATPPTGTGFPSGSTTIGHDSETYYPEESRDVRSLSGAVDQSIFPAGMTLVKLLYVKVQGGDLTIKLTSAGGSAQIIPCDKLLVLDTSTRPLTGITVSGSGNVEVFCAGE